MMSAPKRNSEKRTRGPVSHENWAACERGEISRGAIEIPLYSDVHFVGEIIGCGPCSVFNLVRIVPNLALPALTLRIELHGANDPGASTRNDKGEIETDFSNFTGSSLGDEIAALLSLAHGARIAAGDTSRRFEPGGDPRGKPEVDRNPPPPLALPHSGVVVPAVTKDKTLSTALLSQYKDIDSEAAVALVRSARSYRDAIWLADSHPDLAWLLMVSALETAAVHAVMDEAEPEEILRSASPSIVQILDKHSTELTKQIAPSMAPLFRATNRFIRFVEKYAPPAPDARPEAFAQCAWDLKSMRDAMSKIYGLRSKALHTAIPFPPPMYMPPQMFGGGYEERPIGLAAGVGGSWWTKDDLPMNLHTFEYVTRSVLIAWWAGLPTASGASPTLSQG